MLRVDTQTGLLEGVRQNPSENCDERPAAVPIDLVVIHNISLPPGEYGGPWIDALFTNSLDPAVHPYFADIYQLRVSAHLLIRRTGEIIQYVPFHRRAWHAGVSSYQGRERCNDFSIGIELEGSDHEAYTDAQYERLAKVVVELEKAYPAISRERMTGHCDIAPGRKTDPGPAFDWGRLRHELQVG